MTSILRSNPRKWAVIRKQVLLRDAYTCQLKLDHCTLVATTVDHIIPRKYEGSDELQNLQAACSNCNNDKGSGFLDLQQQADAGHRFIPPFVTIQGDYSQKDDDDR